jgi:hypothetical protein
MEDVGEERPDPSWRTGGGTGFRRRPRKGLNGCACRMADGPIGQEARLVLTADWDPQGPVGHEIDGIERLVSDDVIDARVGE